MNKSTLWRLLRPFTLTASIIPVLIGTTLAMQSHSLQTDLFMAMLVASILIQSATNMFNEYYDYKRGLDTAESVGIGGAIVRDGIQPRTVMILALVFFAVSVLFGFYIVLQTTWWIAVIGSLCMAMGYFYTGGRYPIAYTPFGELVSGFFMGVMIVGIAYYIQTEWLNLAFILAASIPISLLVGALMMANNIRDRVEDQGSGRKTLAIMLGHNRAILLLAAMFVSAYLWTFGLILTLDLSWWLLLILLSIPKANQAYQRFIGHKKPAEMMPAMQATAQLHTLFGLLFSLGLFLGQL